MHLISFVYWFEFHILQFPIFSFSEENASTFDLLLVNQEKCR